jgi:hypothetical protein
MLSMKNLKVSTKLRLLVAISVVGLLVFGAITYLTINKVRVGGPVHNEMVIYTNLDADIEPPALDIERIRFAVLKMLADGKDKLSENVAMYQQRRKEYLESNEKWLKQLPEGKSVAIPISAIVAFIVRKVAS